MEFERHLLESISTLSLLTTLSFGWASLNPWLTALCIFLKGTGWNETGTWCFYFGSMPWPPGVLFISRQITSAGSLAHRHMLPIHTFGYSNLGFQTWVNRTSSFTLNMLITYFQWWNLVSPEFASAIHFGSGNRNLPCSHQYKTIQNGNVTSSNFFVGYLEVVFVIVVVVVTVAFWPFFFTQNSYTSLSNVYGSLVSVHNSLCPPHTVLLSK